MDKSWINLDLRASIAYVRGAVSFLDFAFQKSSNDGKILCPCVKCVNTYWHPRSIVFEHIICHDFLRGYYRWTFHGEFLETSSFDANDSRDEERFNHDIHGLLNDTFPMHVEEEGEDFNMDEAQQQSTDKIEGMDVNMGEEHQQPIEGQQDFRRDDANKFFDLLRDAEQEVYPNAGNKHSKLSVVVSLYHFKCMGGWSNKSFSCLLEYLKDLLPKGNTLPCSYHELKKIISSLGLTYEKIDACPNDCMLYWKDKVDDEACSKCGKSRWKSCLDVVEEEDILTSKKVKKKSAKVLRWFPLIPRLQRLFMSSKTAHLMKWHFEGRNKDGLLRHPADSKAWKDFDSRYPNFSADPRNVRLALTSDGFNPFQTMNVTHSTWPVIVIPYNMPPWLCMKQTNFILSLLIPGSKGPGNNIDVYMQPLVEELKELWEVGIKTFDASTNESFQMHAMLLWTINDFPAYANLSGWSTRGKCACPACGYDTYSKWLKNSGKYCYMGHRRWLKPNHKFQNDKKSFDGTQEHRFTPRRPSGTLVLRQLDDIEFEESGWKKKSIFFDLPYWEYNVIRHNFDVMHIEKNVCDNLLGTIMGQEGKTKDNYKARLDLVEMGIRSELHPKDRPSGNGKYLPMACYQMTLQEKDTFLKVLKEMKVSDECSKVLKILKFKL